MDREKVIKGLDICLKNIESQDCPSNCPYFSDCSKYENRVVFQPLMRDALALLKEQETVEPKTGHWIRGKYDDIFMCSSCEKYSMDDYPYCHWCGAKMKQEGR